MTQIAVILSTHDIGDLADADLTEIFKHLPPLDRLLVSGVCKRWLSISRLPWTDVKCLDLSPIPSNHIAAIIGQCPNLQTVFALRKTFGPNVLRILSGLSFLSLKLFECTSLFPAAAEHLSMAERSIAFSAAFSDNLQDARWRELVLVEFLIEPRTTGPCISHSALPTALPVQLRRFHLHIGRLDYLLPSTRWFFDDRDVITFINKLAQLRDLECLILHVLFDSGWETFERGLPRLAVLKNLRELYLGSNGIKPNVGLLGLSLTKLETLFLHNAYGVYPESDFSKLVTQHPSLRILMMTGNFFTSLDFPTRMRYGCGFSAKPFPQLHVFVGKEASERIRFPKFPSDAAKVYPINEPLPQFLDRADISPIFEDVWIAERIREVAKHGGQLYNYANDVATSLVSSGAD